MYDTFLEFVKALAMPFAICFAASKCARAIQAAAVLLIPRDININHRQRD